MGKRIAVILHGEIDNDNRVLKMCSTLSAHYEIDVYFVGNNSRVALSNVSFISVKYPNSLLQKIRRHTLFCREYAFLYNAVLATSKQYDILWSNDLPTLQTGFKLSKKLNAKLVYDAHEIYVETLNQFFPERSHFPKNSIVYILLNIMRFHGRRVEKKLSRKVDLFITVNDSLADYFRTSYRIEQPLKLMNFPNQAPTAEKRNPPIDYRTLFAWAEEDRVFLYQGVLNQGRGLIILLEAVKELPSHYKLVLLGSGPLEFELTSFIQRNALSDRVKMIPKVPVNALARYTRGADVGINLLENLNLSKKLASPNKLFEYIHSSIPVVCSNTVENQKVIEAFPIGVLAENTHADIRNAMIEVVENNAFHSTENQAIFDAAIRTFSWENQEATLKEALVKLFNKK